MSEERKKEENKKERRFSQEQYDMLKRCSEKRDITEWNEWRKKNPNEDILLEGAELWGVHLKRANLMTDREFVVNEGEIEFSAEVHLEHGELSESRIIKGR